jgi:hypothetical protein
LHIGIYSNKTEHMQKTNQCHLLVLFIIISLA